MCSPRGSSRVMKILAVVSLVSLLLVAARCADEVSGDVVLTRVARALDLTTHLVKQKASITVENGGEGLLRSFLYTVEPPFASKLAYIGAQVDVGDDEATQELHIHETTLGGEHSDVAAYRVDLLKSLASKESVTITIETVFSLAIVPFPREITQADPQLVQFTGNAYFLSPYPIKTQSTTVTLPNTKIESFSRVSPVNTNENEITYGPYTDLPAFSHAKMVLHFENNGPFIGAVSLERIIEVSHWGNIAVEEHVHIKHLGATLKGPFSRYDYQRAPNSGPSSVKSYKTLLPAASRDVYYRDEIGNISTSHLREDEDFMELELTPRFPLFGGWQTRYYMGYNIPSYEYLYRSGSHFMLKMRVVDHLFDDQHIENLVLKIILPEGARSIVLKPPYPLESKPTALHYTYLDTMGRPVVIASKQNVVEQHIQDFELHYTFEMMLLLQEPLLVMVAFYILFLLVILFVRLDFSITKDTALLARQQAVVLLESILQAHDKRTTLVTKYQDSIASYKQNKDVKGYKNTKRQLDERYRSYTDTISTLNKQLQGTDSERASRISEVQKKSGELKREVDEAYLLADSVVSGSMGKQQYVERDRAIQSRLSRLQNEIDAIVQGLGL